jgi:flagellar motor component MotA
MKSNMGKQIKDVGTFLIVIGVVFALAIVFVLFAGDSSPLGQFVNHNFFFITVGGLLCFLIGIIVRSIGRTKEEKAKEQK